MFSSCEEQKGHQELSLRISWIRVFDAWKKVRDLLRIVIYLWRLQKSSNKSKNIGYSSKDCPKKVYPRASLVLAGSTYLLKDLRLRLLLDLPKKHTI